MKPNPFMPPSNDAEKTNSLTSKPLSWLEIRAAFEGHWVALHDVQWDKEQPRAARVSAAARCRSELMRQVRQDKVGRRRAPPRSPISKGFQNSPNSGEVILYLSPVAAPLRQHPENALI